MSLWQHIELQIGQHLGRDFRIENRQPVGGGSINNAYHIGDETDQFFVKTNRQNLAYMFSAEYTALHHLNEAGAIRVPKPITTGKSGHDSYFVMSWLNLSGQPKGSLFGAKMAQLHRQTNNRFGFDIDNTIGSTPQLNQWSDNWVDFWQKQRLGYQLELARKNGFSHRLYDLGLQLSEKTPLFFTNYQPVPSLLHGDLWSGNWSGDENGEPVIFDPASYYGDRETDLAMMELFGRPGQSFYSAYQEHYPLHAEYSIRKNFYNLYHILNHANLFGASYAVQAENMIESLLAEAG